LLFVIGTDGVYVVSLAARGRMFFFFFPLGWAILPWNGPLGRFYLDPFLVEVPKQLDIDLY